MVLDPFLGSGTTVAVARELGRHGVGCELNPEYAAMARVRIGEAERPSTFRDESRVDDESTLFALTHNAPQGEEQQ
jgi:DNA modification methylase